MDAITCTAFGKIYRSRSLMRRIRETVALEGLTLNVPQGTIFGLLGPNGAGKTTTVRMLATLLTPTSGSASVLGFDVVKQAQEVRKRIGLVLGGDRGLYGRLTGRENLRYFGALNHMNPRQAALRINDLLNLTGLSDRADSMAEEYSRGMKQRLHIARGLLTDPDVLFLDEPTIGLDPIGAQEIRRLLPELVKKGKTILLTTHYMFEADALCDSIAIIDLGRLLVSGTPTEVKRTFSNIRITEVTLREPRADLLEELERLPQVQRVTSGTEDAFQKLTIHTRPDTDFREWVIRTVGEANIENLVVRDPTLEEAYVSILG